MMKLGEYNEQTQDGKRSAAPDEQAVQPAKE